MINFITQNIQRKDLNHLFILVMIAVFVLINRFAPVSSTIAQQSDQNLYLDPVDTAFSVEKISPFTPNINENLPELEESLFFSQKKDNEYLDKELAKNNFITQPTKLEREYVIADGDTLTGIANKFNMHVATIYERNGLSADNIESIKPGDKLIIPAYDQSNSQQWLAELNDKKEQERQRLLALEQQRLADEQTQYLASLNTRSVYTRDTSNTGRTVDYNSSGSNAYPYGWCTYYVASRRAVPGSWGNAGQWLGSASSDGYSTGSAPSAGAILVTGESWWGHVAIVESVNGDSVTVSEMNYNGWGVVSSRTISASNPVIMGYIY